jgi:hypothetical protein
MSDARTIRISLAEGRRPSQRATMPVQPMDALAVPIAAALLIVPNGAAAYFDASGQLPADYLEALVARFALAEVLGAEWGLRQGPLTFEVHFVWPGESEQMVVRCFSAEGRLLIITHEDRREEVPALEPRWLLPESAAFVAEAARRSHRFSLDWAAAAQTQAALERMSRRLQEKAR